MKLLNTIKNFFFYYPLLFLCISRQVRSADYDWSKYLDSTPVKDIPSLMTLISSVLKWAQFFLYGAAAVVCMIAAYGYLTSKGEPEKTKTAQNTILYAVIAVVVGLIAGGAGLILDSMFGH